MRDIGNSHYPNSKDSHETIFLLLPQLKIDNGRDRKYDNDKVGDQIEGSVDDPKNRVGNAIGRRFDVKRAAKGNVGSYSGDESSDGIKDDKYENCTAKVLH